MPKIIREEVLGHPLTLTMKTEGERVFWEAEYLGNTKRFTSETWFRWGGRGRPSRCYGDKWLVECLGVLKRGQ